MSDEHPCDIKTLCTRHLKFGWWSLLCYVVLGIVLEAMHGFKVGWYLGQSSEMRRLLWTLGHAHGTLLSLVHVAFAFTYTTVPTTVTGRLRLASALLMASTVLLPGGFFLGGIIVFEGDPGIGIWLVPIGAISLFLAVLLTATGVARDKRHTMANDGERPRRGQAPKR